MKLNYNKLVCECQRFLFSKRINFETGFILFVKRALRACLTLVLARVFFIAADLEGLGWA